MLRCAAFTDIYLQKNIVSKLVCFVFSALNEKSIYAIINVVKIANILPPETITNVLNQQTQIRSILICGELANTIEKDNVYSMNPQLLFAKFDYYDQLIWLVRKFFAQKIYVQKKCKETKTKSIKPKLFKN